MYIVNIEYGHEYAIRQQQPAAARVLQRASRGGEVKAAPGHYDNDDATEIRFPTSQHHM